MSTRAQGDWEDENGARERQQEVGTTRSRRALLGGAAGGFALAASGLVLPEWLIEEAEAADNHPVRRVQDRQDGQRTQRRRRLEHRRAQNRREDANTGRPPGRGPLDIRSIKFLVDVTGEHPIKADVYWPRFRPGRPDFWDLKGTKAVAPSAGEAFAASSIDAVLWLDDRILVRAANEPILEPLLTIGHDGAFWAGERGWEGGTVVFNDRLLKDEGTPVFTLSGYSIRVVRIKDDDDYIRYNVAVSRV